MNSRDIATDVRHFKATLEKFITMTTEQMERANIDTDDYQNKIKELTFTFQKLNESIEHIKNEKIQKMIQKWLYTI